MKKEIDDINHMIIEGKDRFDICMFISSSKKHYSAWKESQIDSIRTIRDNIIFSINTINRNVILEVITVGVSVYKALSIRTEYCNLRFYETVDISYIPTKNSCCIYSFGGKDDTVLGDIDIDHILGLDVSEIIEIFSKVGLVSKKEYFCDIDKVSPFILKETGLLK